MPLPGILPGWLGVSYSGPWRGSGVNVPDVVDTCSCPGSLRDPDGSPVVPALGIQVLVAGGRSGRWHLCCIVLWHGALRRHSSGGSTESPVSTVMPLPGILPGGLGVSSSGPWRCTGVDVLYVVDTRSCPGSLQDPVGSPVVPGGFLGDSVVVVSALSSVLWSLLWLGLRVTAALGGGTVSLLL